MNIIFLDIDGTVSTFRFIDYQIKYNECNYYEADKNFDPICMKYLRDLIFHTKSKVVISSSWRVSEELMNEIKYNFNKFNIGSDKIIGKTNYNTKTRGEQIDEWIEDNIHKVKNYIILDDEICDIHQRNNVVQCDSYYGFRENNFKQALEILNAK